MVIVSWLLIISSGFGNPDFYEVMGHLKEVDPEIYDCILKETERQEANIELIASENFVSEAVLEAGGSVLTNKYAEGYPKARWYGGCQFIDKAEELAVARAKRLFGAEHANVQPHSGTQANMAVFFAALEVGDTILAMDLACGGHLTHGHPKNYSGKYFKAVFYGVRRDTEEIDYDQIATLAKSRKPRLILAGASAYPRIIDFGRFRETADSVGAYLMVDMAHIAGLVAAGIHPSPVPYAEFITTTTHKTLRGPRGGMILCRKEFAKRIDAAVFPGIQGGPLEHIIAAKAVALHEAQEPNFKAYQHQTVLNARALTGELASRGYRIVSGTTDTHLVLVDLAHKDMTGRLAQEVLDRARITVNKNLLPFDERSAAETSGIRIGTPAVTTRGMREPQMTKVAELMDLVISSNGGTKVIEDVRREVDSLTKRFPLYRERIEAIKRDC